MTHTYFRSLFLLIPVVLISLVATVLIITASKDLDTSSILPVQSENQASSLTTSKDIEIQGWIYPGEETCSVSQELKQNIEVDVLKIEFFTIDSTGKITLLPESSSGCNGYSPAAVEMVKNHSLSQYVTVSGRHENMVKFFNNESTIEQGISTLSEFVTTNDLTGIEIDFEDFSSWTDSDYNSYKEFVTKLGRKLISQDKKLMVAGPPIANEIDQTLYRWRYSDMSNLPVSQIVVMAYDYQADHGNGQAVAPTSWVAEVVEYTRSEIANDSKIVIGVPAYGYTGKSGEYTSKLLTKAQALAASNEYSEPIRDHESFELISQNRSNVLVYSDQITVQQKVDFVRSLGISSISIWHLGNNDWYIKN